MVQMKLLPLSEDTVRKLMRQAFGASTFYMRPLSMAEGNNAYVVELGDIEIMITHSLWSCYGHSAYRIIISVECGEEVSFWYDAETLERMPSPMEMAKLHQAIKSNLEEIETLAMRIQDLDEESGETEIDWEAHLLELKRLYEPK